MPAADAPEMVGIRPELGSTRGMERNQADDDPADVAVREIWEKRRPETDARIETLEEAAAALVEGRLDGTLRRAGVEAAHKLSGSLGSFGYPRASELAFQAEALLGRDAPPDVSDAPRLAGWIEGIWIELESPPSRPSAPIPAAKPVATPSETTHDVVVVEDDPVLAELLLHMLRNEGYEPEWFDDGGKAMEVLTGDPPSVVPRVLLLDVDLPGVSGTGVLRAMKEAGGLDRTSVIMLTAHASEDETVKMFELGATDHVAKPFSLPVLLQRVRRAIGE